MTVWEKSYTVDIRLSEDIGAKHEVLVVRSQNIACVYNDSDLDLEQIEKLLQQAYNAGRRDLREELVDPFKYKKPTQE